MVFLSATQLVLPSTEQTIPQAYPEALAATYPKLNFSTYLGGSDWSEDGNGIAVTEDGSCYLTGRTKSSDFPTQNAFNTTYSGDTDAFVAKLDSSGSLIWSTFFGGSDHDVGNDISIAGDGSCYVIGNTRSSDFPTQNAYNSTYGGNDDTFVAKFSSSGHLLWSTYLGGNDFDWGYSIAVASDGSCYVIGETYSSNFPTKNAFDSTFNGDLKDAFVSKFSTNGTILWSSYLGGNDHDYGYGIAVTNDGSCYVTGHTRSSDFPTLDAYDPTHNGYDDVFVSKFNASGSLLWSTYLGGASRDEALGIAVAGDGSCYITGYTSASDFPTKNAFNSTHGGYGDAFVTKFSSEGLLLWSTYLGGSDTDRGHDIAVTSDGSCYVSGETYSSNFPTKNAYNSSLSGSLDAFISKFNASGFLLWSTYLGGSEGRDSGNSIAVTEDGSCFVIGSTSSDDFPTQNAYDNTLGAMSDAFVTKFIDSPIPLVNGAGRQRLIRSISISISLLLFIITSIVIYSIIVPPLLRNRKVLQVLGEYAKQRNYQILLTELCEKTKLPETLLEKTLLDSKVQQIQQTVSYKENVYLVSLMDFEQLVASIEKRISSVEEKRVSEEIRFQTITSSKIELEVLKALASKLSKQGIVAKCDGIISLLDDMIQGIEIESLLDE